MGVLNFLIGALGLACVFAGIVGAILGLIKPSLVIRWGNSKTRLKAFSVSLFLFIAGFSLFISIAPSSFENGKEQLSERNYKDAVRLLEKVKPSDENYEEAKNLLGHAREGLYLRNIDQAKVESELGKHEEVVNLLSGIRDGDVHKDSIDLANELLEKSRKALVLNNLKLEEQKKLELSAKEEERLISDFPKCDSKRAFQSIRDTMDNAPLGRTLGLSIVDFSDVVQVSVSGNERSCRANVYLTNARVYQMKYRFHRLNGNIFSEAEIIDLF